MSDTPIDPLSRFALLAQRGIRRFKATLEAPADPDPEVELAKALSGWSALPAARTFIEHLDARIALAEELERQAVRSHPDLCYAMGQKDALKRLRDDFIKWAG